MAHNHLGFEAWHSLLFRPENMAMRHDRARYDSGMPIGRAFEQDKERSAEEAGAPFAGFARDLRNAYRETNESRKRRRWKKTWSLHIDISTYQRGIGEQVQRNKPVQGWETGDV